MEEEETYEEGPNFMSILRNTKNHKGIDRMSVMPFFIKKYEITKWAMRFHGRTTNRPCAKGLPFSSGYSPSIFSKLPSRTSG